MWVVAALSIAAALTIFLPLFFFGRFYGLFKFSTFTILTSSVGRFMNPVPIPIGLVVFGMHYLFALLSGIFVLVQCALPSFRSKSVWTDRIALGFVIMPLLWVQTTIGYVYTFAGLLEISLPVYAVMAAFYIAATLCVLMRFGKTPDYVHCSLGAALAFFGSTIMHFAYISKNTLTPHSSWVQLALGAAWLTACLYFVRRFNSPDTSPRTPATPTP
jgi:hypothetical protein